VVVRCVTSFREWFDSWMRSATSSDQLSSKKRSGVVASVGQDWLQCHEGGLARGDSATRERHSSTLTNSRAVAAISPSVLMVGASSGWMNPTATRHQSAAWPRMS